MKDRLKEIRKTNTNWKTQDDFATFLGISKSNLSSYEAGRRTPSDAVIQLICQKCNVNEEWLRTGTGEMFQPVTKNDEIARLLGNVSKMDDSNFRRRLINALAKLDDDGWTHLEELIDMIVGEK